VNKANLLSRKESFLGHGASLQPDKKTLIAGKQDLRRG